MPNRPAPRITAREISASIGITEKATRNIINNLEADGYVTKKREDAHQVPRRPRPSPEKRDPEQAIWISETSLCLSSL
jgi:DNA-binding MarR family transcriptional regulator